MIRQQFYSRSWQNHMYCFSGAIELASQALPLVHSGPRPSACVQIPLRSVSHFVTIYHPPAPSFTNSAKSRASEVVPVQARMLVFNFQLQRSGHEITEALNSASTVVATYF